MQLWIARSARETSQTGLADPANLPRATRTRKLRARKKMSVPLKPQQKTNHPSTNTRKVVSTTGKTNAKTPGSRMKKKTNEEASLRHEGESSSSDSSDSDDNDYDDDGTGAKYKTCYGDGNGGGDSNTGAGGGSAEWMRFLIPSALSETFGDMAKAKASLSTKSKKTRS